MFTQIRLTQYKVSYDYKPGVLYMYILYNLKLLNVSIFNLKCLILRLGIFVMYRVISKATEVAELKEVK